MCVLRQSLSTHDPANGNLNACSFHVGALPSSPSPLWLSQSLQISVLTKEGTRSETSRSCTDSRCTCPKQTVAKRSARALQDTAAMRYSRRESTACPSKPSPHRCGARHGLHALRVRRDASSRLFCCDRSCTLLASFLGTKRSRDSALYRTRARRGGTPIPTVGARRRLHSNPGSRSVWATQLL